VIVYVETNFLLELAYLQERCDSCNEILELSRAGAITLTLPAYSAVEARATWHRRASERRDFHALLQKHIRELTRSEPFRGLTEQSRDIVAALVAGGEESRERLEAAIEMIAQHGRIIPLTSEIVGVARGYELRLSLLPQDAHILASVKSDAEQQTGPKCFVSQDVKGFANPAVYDDLWTAHCKVLANFQDALAYIRSQAQ
jgi:predicted nucleic acid-binding protein